MKMFHVEHSKRKQISWAGSWIMALIILALTLTAQGQYVTLTGKLQGANGLPAANDILSFTPTQNFYVAGVTPLVVVQATAQCTTTIDGTVAGVPNPLNPPQLSANGSGTLPGDVVTYYVVIVWYDAAGNMTLPSPEAQFALLSTGSLLVNPPLSGMPSNAVGAKVYIGTSSCGETLQGSVVSTGTFTQSTPLITGAVPPTTNTTLCQIIANDAGWPTGTGYMVGLTTPAGATMPGYPMQWQLLGPGGTINLGNGLPLYNGIVTYPSPILASPYNHGPQLIRGPLSLTNYNLTNVGKLGVGTNVPAWGVDVEGTGLSSYINAKGGYLINGSGGAAGQCLASDGTAFDTPASCAGYYQTIALNGTALTQRPALNFVAPFITAADSSSPARTTLTFNATGTENKAVSAASAGTIGHCMQWNAAGGAGDAGGACFTPSSFTLTDKTGTYIAGVTYTAGALPLFESVSMNVNGTDFGPTGCDYQLIVVVNGITIPGNGLHNSCTGDATVSFIVPPGGSFSATPTYQSGGTYTFIISRWVELVF